MALISEWMQQCGKKVLDNAGIVRDACYKHLSLQASWQPEPPLSAYTMLPSHWPVPEPTYTTPFATSRV